MGMVISSSTCNSTQERSAPIKIAYLVDFFRTVNAGTEKQLAYLLEHLPRHGFEVWLISLQDSLFLETQAHKRFPAVQFIALGGHSDISRTPGVFLRLFSLLRKIHPHLVHTFFPTCNGLGVILSRLAGIRSVLTSRRDMGYNLTVRDWRLLRCADRLVSRIVVNSKAVMRITHSKERVPLEKIFVLHNGMNNPPPPECKTPLTNSSPIIVLVANLNRPVKRPDLFIKAAAQVHSKLPGVLFWLVGDGYLRQEMESLAGSLGLRENMVFLGRRQDVPDILRRADIGVCCSDSEGLSNAMMEYMSAGLPVIATLVGGNPELVEHGSTGLLVPPGNESALAEAMSGMLFDPQSARRMGMNGHKSIRERFSVHRMLNESIALYQSLVE